MKKTLKKLAYKVLGLLPSSAILMLHNITDSPLLKKEILLSQDRFYLLIDSFHNWASLESVIVKPSRSGLALTFDDGFEDVYSVAYPYLKAKKIPFTVFVTVEKLNSAGYLTSEQLCELSKDTLCTIGTHCVHHLPLAKMSKEEQRVELLDSKRKIEAAIGKPVRFMAFPYGSYNKTTLKILRETHAYEAACIVGRGFLNIVSGYGRYTKPRIAVDNVVFDKNFALLKEKFRSE